MAATSARRSGSMTSLGAVCCTLLLVFAQLPIGQGRPVQSNQAQLSTDFYKSSCPDFQAIVAKHLAAALAADVTLAASLIRLFFHDAFIQGLDASVLLASTANNTAEMDAPPNLSLRGFATIADMKAELEAKCPKTVSCADIIVATAAGSLVASQGPSVNFEYGRRDGLTSSALLANQGLPNPKSNISTILGQFGAKGFSTKDTVALSGAHTLGRSHCVNFLNRLYPTTDPTLDSSYADLLRSLCPQNFSFATLVVMDPTTPNKFDSNYYINLQKNKGLFNSDEGLEYYNPQGVKALVQVYARSQQAWFRDFASAFTKMSYLSVLVGTAGQIRTNCSVVNQ